MLNFVKFRFIFFPFSFGGAFTGKVGIPCYALLKTSAKGHQLSSLIFSFLFKKNLRYVYGFSFLPYFSYFFSYLYKVSGRLFAVDGLSKSSNFMLVLAVKYLVFIYSAVFSTFSFSHPVYFLFRRLPVCYYGVTAAFPLLIRRYNAVSLLFSAYSLPIPTNIRFFKKKASLKKKKYAILRKIHFSSIAAVNSAL